MTLNTINVHFSVGTKKYKCRYKKVVKGYQYMIHTKDKCGQVVDTLYYTTYYIQPEACLPSSTEE